MSAGRDQLVLGHEHLCDEPDRVVDLRGNLLGAVLQRVLQPAYRRHGAFATGLERRVFGQGHRVVGILRQEGLQRRLGLLLLAQFGLQHGLDRQQAGPLWVFRFQALDVVQAGRALVPLEHPLNFIQFRDQVGAAKLDLLASPTRTR